MVVRRVQDRGCGHDRGTHEAVEAFRVSFSDGGREGEYGGATDDCGVKGPRCHDVGDMDVLELGFREHFVRSGAKDGFVLRVARRSSDGIAMLKEGQAKCGRNVAVDTSNQDDLVIVMGCGWCHVLFKKMDWRHETTRGETKPGIA